MNHEKSKGLNKGETVPMMVVISAICLWTSGLSVAVYTINAQLASVTTSVTAVEKNTEGLPDVKAKINWLAEQQGYHPTVISAVKTSTTSEITQN